MGTDLMDTNENRTTSRCKKLHELQPVFTDWQQTTWCPDCDYYDSGICANPIRKDSSAPCPFDGKVLPLREVAIEPKADQPRKAAPGQMNFLVEP